MASSKFCPNCKQKNDINASQCIYCGVPLEATLGSLISTTTRIGQAAPDAAVHVSHPLRPSVDLPPNVFALFELNSQEPFATSGEAKVVLGRVSGETTEAALIDLSPLGADHLGVSRRHALITRVENQYAIQDLNSTNGTWLNEMRLVPDQLYPLKSGVLVRFGQLVLQAYYRPEDAPEEVLLTLEDKAAPAQSPLVLTPQYLKETLFPFLEALAQLQALLHEAGVGQPGEMKIHIISAGKPETSLGVSLVGGREAIDLTCKWVNPWRTANMSQAIQGRDTLAADALQPQLAALASQIVAEGFGSINESQKNHFILALSTPLLELASNRLQIVEQMTTP